jgi:hypothetical protein
MGHQATTFAATDGARWRRCPRRAMDAARAPSWAGSMSLEDEDSGGRAGVYGFLLGYQRSSDSMISMVLNHGFSPYPQ